MYLKYVWLGSARGEGGGGVFALLPPVSVIFKTIILNSIRRILLLNPLYMERC